MNKQTSLILTIILVAVLIAIIFIVKQPKEYQNIVDFESCAASGNPVMESYPRQCTANGKTYVEVISEESDLESYFTETLRERAIENINGMPIEGFNPELYKQAFSNLQDSDFNGATAIGGYWKYSDNNLIFVQIPGGPISSADGTLNEAGMKIL